MSDEYTPSMDQLRQAYEVAHGLTGSSMGKGEFDRAIAVHDAATREAVLVEVAEVIEQMYFGPDQSKPFSTGANHKWGARQAALRVREMAEGVEEPG